MKKVRKAVLPVAGLGTRFLPATKAVPKEMLPLVDTPSIQLIVEECVGSGIEEIIFVSARGKSSIEDHFDRAGELEALLEKRGKTDDLSRVRRPTEMARYVSVRQAEARGLGHAGVRADRDVHPDVACQARQDGADGETDCCDPVQRKAECHKQNRADHCDSGVLAIQIRRRALLNGGGNLTHAIIAGGLLDDPQRPDDAENDADRRAAQRDDQSSECSHASFSLSVIGRGGGPLCADECHII